MKINLCVPAQLTFPALLLVVAMAGCAFRPDEGSGEHERRSGGNRSILTSG